MGKFFPSHTEENIVESLNIEEKMIEFVDKIFHRQKLSKLNYFIWESPCGQRANTLDGKQNQIPIMQLCSLSNLYSWESYETPYLFRYVLNSTTAVLQQGCVWH